MISIVICSINAEKLKKVSENITETIGVPFEILSENNLEKKAGLCEVYNSLAANASFPFLCFLHEDVVFQKKGWGKVLIELLNDYQIGLVGHAGCVYKSQYPGNWSSALSQLYRDRNFQEKHTIEISGNHAEVTVIDGFFMACRKQVWAEFRFDDQFLKSFHGYDIDFSLAIGLKYKVLVTYEIAMIHLSKGNMNQQWLVDSIRVHEKWKHSLPRNTIQICDDEKTISDYISLQCIMNVGLKDKVNYLLVITTYCRLLFRYFKYNRFSYSKKVIRYLFHTIRGRNTIKLS